jgi:hypothetical protein
MAERLTPQERALLITDDLGPLSRDQAADVPVLAEVLADPSTWVQPSPELEDAVVVAVSAAPGATVTGTVSSIDNRRRSRVAPLVLAAAAVIAIVLAVGAIVLTRDSASPDFTADLAATELLPGAGASAEITPNAGGFRIVLDAHGLPPLAEGEFYQAWLKSPDGTVVPIGTFSSSDDQVTLWSAVSPEDFPTITVTIEATDNDQASSGRVVLKGEVEAVS